jgi:tetratricopeptide (TPR) repeat protein
MPEIRSKKSGGTMTETIKWTAKPNPYTAAREQQFREAPVPHFRQTKLKDGETETEYNNPLWLTDNGDNFLKNGDYYSAINAYSSALRIDDKLVRAQSNRVVCYLKLFNFFEAREDCEAIMDSMSKFDAFDKYTQKNMEMYTKIRVRESICQAWEGKLDTAEERFEVIVRLIGKGDPWCDPISLDEYYRRTEVKRAKDAEEKERTSKLAAMDGQAMLVEKSEEAEKKIKEIGLAKEQPGLQGVKKDGPKPITPADVAAYMEKQKEEKPEPNVIESHDGFDVVQEGDNQFRYVPTSKGPPADSEEKTETPIEESRLTEGRKNLDEIKDDAMENFKNSEFAQNILKSIQSDLEFIANRKRSVAVKLQGDDHFSQGVFHKAKESYEQALEMDPYNEKALANLALIALKKNNNEEVIALTTRALDVICPHLEYNQFSPNIIQSSQIAIGLLSKIYLRRAQAKYNLKELDGAKDDIRNLLLLDERNEAARKLQAKIKIELNLKTALTRKDEADSEFKNKNYVEALLLYDESSKLLDGPENHFDLIKVLLNRSACQLQLEQWENIITTTLRGLR